MSGFKPWKGGTVASPRASTDDKPVYVGVAVFHDELPQELMLSEKCKDVYHFACKPGTCSCLCHQENRK